MSTDVFKGLLFPTSATKAEATAPTLEELFTVISEKVDKLAEIMKRAAPATTRPPRRGASNAAKTMTADSTFKLVGVEEPNNHGPSRPITTARKHVLKAEGNHVVAIPVEA